MIRRALDTTLSAHGIADSGCKIEPDMDYPQQKDTISCGAFTVVKMAIQLGFLEKMLLQEELRDLLEHPSSPQLPLRSFLQDLPALPEEFKERFINAAQTCGVR